jgi:hypothetical protein
MSEWRYVEGTGMVPGKKGLPMNAAALEGFRAIAAAMNTESTDWQWVGPYMSQRMFGITEARAKAYAERHGGEAKKMGA